jgi:hypothetical protein
MESVCSLEFEFVVVDQVAGVKNLLLLVSSDFELLALLQACGLQLEAWSFPQAVYRSGLILVALFLKILFCWLLVSMFLLKFLLLGLESNYGVMALISKYFQTPYNKGMAISQSNTFISARMATVTIITMAIILSKKAFRFNICEGVISQMICSSPDGFDLSSIMFLFVI